ncbi:hypothetical protein A4A49_41970 [Nicotiana attenuata]|uniref:Carboxypeptidase A inhibitor-like domain-containing protein n=1 Tax=Nicotiana attenuata TaxID=49451 RepID=A0A1J6KAD4_NICAT|nr:hypothetical protein A4A49_41970 [Nicotiana attenuata]
MTLLKLGFFLAILLMAAATIKAAPNVDLDVSKMARRLLPQLNTCLRSCENDSGCSDCWLCCTCKDFYGAITLMCQA